MERRREPKKLRLGTPCYHKVFVTIWGLTYSSRIVLHFLIGSTQIDEAVVEEVTGNYASKSPFMSMLVDNISKRWVLSPNFYGRQTDCSILQPPHH